MTFADGDAVDEGSMRETAAGRKRSGRRRGSRWIRLAWPGVRTVAVLAVAILAVAMAGRPGEPARSGPVPGAVAAVAQDVVSPGRPGTDMQGPPGSGLPEGPDPGTGSPGDPDGEEPDGPGADFRFVDATEEAGLAYEHGFHEDRAESMAGNIAAGVAVGDVDGDDWIDLYVVRGARGPAMLMLNQGDGTFLDVAPAWGVDLDDPGAAGPAFGDLDGDVYLDLIVGGIDGASPRLYRGGAGGGFAEMTALSRVRSFDKNTFSAAWADTDGDGDLELFLSHWDFHCEDDCAGGHLWRNDGNGVFREIDEEAGIVGFRESDYSFTPNFSDIDGDGRPDLLIASDFGTSQVFLNDGAGHFVDITDPEVITDDNGMGAALGDFDADGDFDWFVTSILNETGSLTGNRLYRNDGDGVFVDATTEAGVRDGGWGWGACSADFDNDGDLDIFHVNGWYPNELLLQRPRLFLNDGDGTFREQGEEHGVDETIQGRGAACFDYDRDGDIDVFVAPNQDESMLLRNEGGNDGNWLQLLLQGEPPNVWGVGARVEATVDGRVQVREVRMGSNFVSQDPPELHFGLGEAERVDLLTVRWPDGERQVFVDVPANQFLRVVRVDPDVPG